MHFKHNTILLLLPSLFIFFSCRNKGEEFVQKQIEKAIDLGEEHPQEALSILDSVQNPEDLSQTNYMLYQIADVRANRNANNLIREDQLKLITEAIVFFEKEGDTKNSFLANYYAARAYRFPYSSQANTAQELTHYLKAYSYAEKMNDSLSMGKTLYNIGVMYYDQGINDSTNSYLKRATPLFNNYPHAQVQAFRMLALSYYLKNDYVNALLYLDKGKPLLKEKDNKQYEYAYNTLYGNIYKSEKEYNQSIDYLSKNITDSIPESEKARTALNLLEIYTTTNQLDSAAYYATYAEPKLKDIQENKLLLFAYTILQEYYSKLGDTARSKAYSILFKDIEKVIKEQNEAETLFIADKEFKTNQLDKSQSGYQKVFYYLIISMLVLTVLILFIIKRIKRKREKLINQQEKQMEDLNQNVARSKP